MHKVAIQYDMEIGKEMFYMFNGFHQLPHGGVDLQSAINAKKKLEKAGVLVVDINKSHI